LRNKDGMGGWFDELEPYMIKYPYTTKERCDKWGEIGSGWDPEISGDIGTI